LLVLLLALAVTAGLPGVTWAAAEGEKPSILSPRFDLGIWTIVIFVALLFVLRKFAWGPMLEGLQKREHGIHAAIEESNRARDEAQRLRADMEARITKAHEEVRGIVEEGRRDAERLSTDLQAKARTEIQAERDRMRREIEMARDQALQQLWNESAALASQISAKAIGRHISSDDHRRLVDDALTELRTAGSARLHQIADLKL
jgi:F-type H+-transporting ATPase subunit b